MTCNEPHLWMCDLCGRVATRGQLPADNVADLRHNCDGMQGDIVRDVLLGRGRRGRMVPLNEHGATA